MSRLHAILTGRDRSLAGRSARAACLTASPFYRFAVELRNAAFDRDWRLPRPLGRPTVSVGNLTAGGTGKTPMVIELARRLVAKGRRPAVLTRGYGDDETLELRHALAALGAGPVEADGNRARAAFRVLEHEPAVDCFVLDDAFQHRQVHRDLDLVLVDATEPFGGGRVLPAGLLREPMRNLRRADGVVVTRADQVDAAALSALDARLAELAGTPPLAHAAHEWRSLLDGDDSPLPLADLGEMAVLGVCGIGNPASFARRLGEHAGRVAEVHGLGDHHRYSHDELTSLLLAAERIGVDAVVTTEKDWVKWRPLLADHPPPVPVLRPVLAMRLLDGERAFDTLLGERIAPAQPQ